MQLNQKIGQLTGFQKCTMQAQYSHQKSINKPAIVGKPAIDSSFKPTTGRKGNVIWNLPVKLSLRNITSLLALYNSCLSIYKAISVLYGFVQVDEGVTGLLTFSWQGKHPSTSFLNLTLLRVQM